jgi:hypothetical protein
MGELTYEQLQVKLAEETKKRAEAEELADHAIKANEELTKKLSEKPEKGSKAKLPSFTLDKVKYQFTMSSFTLKGVKYTASDAAKDESLCKELVKRKAGCIKTV